MVLRIRTKIIMSLGTVSVLLSLLGFIAYYNRNALFESVRRLEDIAHELSHFSEIRFGFDSLLMPPNDYLITGDRSEKTRFDELASRLEREIGELEKVKAFENNDPEELKRVISKFRVLSARAADIFALEDPVANPEGAALMRELDAISADIISTHLNPHYVFERELLSRETADAAALMRRVDILLYAGTALSVLVLLGFAYYLIRSILIPILKFQESARIIRKGDLKHRIQIEDGLEVNVLAGEFNEMAEQLLKSYEGLEKKVEERTRELNEVNERLKELSITDGLTGAYNRRHLFDIIENEIKRAGRYGRGFAVILGDIDFFKHYNDTNGHLEGDEVLKGVAACIRRSLREQDILSRYGGEEFCMVLLETNARGARIAAERVRADIEAESFPNEKAQPGGELTMSLGISVYPENGSDPKALVKAADESLYEAKRRGRNRVEGPCQP